MNGILGKLHIATQISSNLKVLCYLQSEKIWVAPQATQICGVFFSGDVQLKSSFSDEKTSGVKSETNFSREAIEN